MAIVGRSLKTPMSKDLSDISGRLAIPGNAACAFHGAGTRIVGSHREVNHAEPVEQLPQIADLPGLALLLGHGSSLFTTIVLLTGQASRERQVSIRKDGRIFGRS